MTDVVDLFLYTVGIWNFHRTPTIAKSKVHTIKRHKCFQRYRSVRRESIDCRVSMDALQCFDGLVHLHSYMRCIL